MLRRLLAGFAGRDLDEEGGSEESGGRGNLYEGGSGLVEGDVRWLVRRRAGSGGWLEELRRGAVALCTDPHCLHRPSRAAHVQLCFAAVAAMTTTTQAPLPLAAPTRTRTRAWAPPATATSAGGGAARWRL